jgi:hypothetical protein
VYYVLDDCVEVPPEDINVLFEAEYVGTAQCKMRDIMRSDGTLNVRIRNMKVRQQQDRPTCAEHQCVIYPVADTSFLEEPAGAEPAASVGRARAPGGRGGRARRGLADRRGPPRARSHCHFVLTLIHFIPDSLT